MDRGQSTTKTPKGIEIRSRNGVERIRINIKVPGKSSPLRKNLGIDATPANIKYAENLLNTIRERIRNNCFDITEFFPDEAPQSTQKTISELLEERMERKRALGLQGSANGWQLSTYGDRVKRHENWIKPFFGDLTIQELTPNHIRNFLKTAQGVLAAHSAKMTLSLLNPLINEAMAEGTITTHPIAHINIGDYLVTKTTAQRKEVIDPLSIDEMRKMFNEDNHSHTSHANLFKFMLMTGVRRQEAPLVKWAAYEPSKAKLTLSEAIGTTNNAEYAKGLKVGDSRTIDLLPEAIEAIEAQRALTYAVSEYIFLNNKTDKPFNLKQLYHLWKKACATAGIPYRSIKQTRHTFISTMLALGENSSWIRHQSGHKNTAMFDLHYAKWIDIGKETRKAIRIDEIP